MPNLFLFYSTRILPSNLLASSSGRKAKFRSKYTDELCLKSQFANHWTWFDAQTVHMIKEGICFKVASIQQSNSFRTCLKFDWMLWFQNYTHRLTREIGYDSIIFHSIDCSKSACRLHPNFWPEISLRAISTKLNVQTQILACRERRYGFPMYASGCVWLMAKYRSPHLWQCFTSFRHWSRM